MFTKIFYRKEELKEKLLFFLFLFLFLVWFSYSLIGQDLFFVFVWWFSLWLIGFIFLPLTVKIFPYFFDNGYLFSKTIGLVFLTLTLWVFSILKILPFYRVSIFVLLVLFLGVIFFKLKGLGIIKPLKNKEFFIYEEVVFFLALVFFSFVRGQLPDIHGVEKFMDFAFLNNLLRTKFMPPVDMWLAGKTANYYYYGHYVFAFLTKLTGIRSSITYNLAIATLFAFGFSLTFSLTANLIYILGKKSIKSAIFGGLISAFLLSLGGNLHTFIYAIFLPFAKKIGLYSGEVKPYFYADPRSYIGHYPPTNDKLITEYPAYSYVLGDLHAQIINVCFVLTLVALLFASFIRIIEERKKKGGRCFYGVLDDLVMILMFPVLWMTNAWDFPIYFVVMNLVFLGANLTKYKWQIKKSIINTLSKSLTILIISLILLLPFLIKFINPTQGFHLTRLNHLLSPLYWFQLFVVWGYQTFFVILFVIFLLKREIKPHIKNLGSKNFLNNLKTAFLDLPITDVFILIISLCAVGLVVVSEIFYQKDISAQDFYRANTVWKVTLQAFVLFDIVVGYIVIRLFTQKREKAKEYILKTIVAFVLGIVMLYPFYSISQPYNKLRDYKELEGTSYLKNLYPDDYKAIRWLNSNISNQPVIVEAVGESYTDFARVSANTGLPTILGWRVHEWYWRGSFDEPGKRTGEVQEIYESPDLGRTKMILNKYNVEYVFIGALERHQYQNLKEEKFAKLGEVVFTSGNTKIYKVSNQ